MHPFTSVQEQGFAAIFAVIVLSAAIPNAYAFLQKMHKIKTDSNLKLTMLQMGSSADEIVWAFMSQRVRSSPTQQA